MRYILLTSAFALAACSSTAEEQTADEQAARNARAVAEVRANQVPPPEQLQPEPILQADIEENDLSGGGCNFLPEGRGTDAIAIAQEDKGFMKRSGEVLSFAADKGSAKQLLNSYRKYDGKLYGFTLDLIDDNSDSDAQGEVETSNLPARLTVRDGRGRTVYAAPGTAQCNS